VEKIEKAASTASDGCEFFIFVVDETHAEVALHAVWRMMPEMGLAAGWSGAGRWQKADVLSPKPFTASFNCAKLLTCTPVMDICKLCPIYLQLGCEGLWSGTPCRS
jgi:hypothetical protein